MPKYQLKKPSTYRYRPYANALGYVGRLAVRKGIDYIGNRLVGTKSTTSGGKGITTQYDSALIYKKKRMPRKMRRKFRRAAKRFTYNLQKQIATQTAVFNATSGGGVWTGAGQIWNFVSLYGWNGSADPAITPAFIGANDVFRIMNNDSELNQAATKVMFTNGVLDLTFRNIGETGLEVDMYTLRATGRRSHLANPEAEISAAESNTPTIGAGGALTRVNRGATPFDFPMFIKYGYTIMRKQKFFVPSGQTFTNQIRDPKQYTFFSQDLDGTCCRGGITKTVLFVVKQVPGFAANLSNSFVIGVTRGYKYKILQDNQVKDVLNPV